MNDEKDVLISIIVPVYNAEQYLRQCLESLCNQTVSKFEIILVDDGSDDSSGMICDTFASNNANIKVIHKKNGGVVSARKMGISYSLGQFIGFVDADDYIDADYYATLLALIEDNKTDVVHVGYMEEHDQWNRPVSSTLFGLYDLTKDREQLIIEELSALILTPSIWSKLFKRDLLVKTYGALNEEQQMGEDFLLLIRCFFEANTIFISDYIGYHYRVLKESMSHGRGQQRLLSYVGEYDELRKIITHYCDVDDHRYDVYALNSFLRAIRMFYILPNYAPQNWERLNGKKIIIFGAGRVGLDYYVRLSMQENVNILAWMDTYPYCYNYLFCSIQDVRNICNYSFDYVVIAAKDKKLINELEHILLELGVGVDRIIAEEPTDIWD